MSTTLEPAPSLDVVAIDDDADFREYLRSLLEDDGHRVRVVAEPDALYETCEKRLPELVLLDIKMGDALGEEVLAEIRKRWPRLCVIVVTGYPSLDSMRSTFKQDVFDYVAKPFSADDLRRVLSQAAESEGLGKSAHDRLRAELGRQIRLERTGRGWTLKELSEASGVSVSQLSSVERGTHLPSLDSLAMIASALGTRPSRWLGEAGF